MTQPVDLVVDRGVLLYVRVGGGKVRLGLVVVVVGDEELNAVSREQVAQLRGHLCRERLVRLDDEGGTLGGLDRPRHRGRLPAPGDPQESLVAVASCHPLCEGGYRARLVTRRAQRGDDLQIGHAPIVPGGCA